MTDIVEIKALVEEIAKTNPVAITASREALRSNTVLLTIHGVDRSSVPDELFQNNTVSVRGTPAQLMTEVTLYGVNSLDGILLYSSDDSISNGADEIMDVGFNSLFNEFEQYAGGYAADSP